MELEHKSHQELGITEEDYEDLLRLDEEGPNGKVTRLTDIALRRFGKRAPSCGLPLWWQQPFVETWLGGDLEDRLRHTAEREIAKIAKEKRLTVVLGHAGGRILHRDVLTFLGAVAEVGHLMAASSDETYWAFDHGILKLYHSCSHSNDELPIQRRYGQVHISWSGFHSQQFDDLAGLFAEISIPKPRDELIEHMAYLLGQNSRGLFQWFPIGLAAVKLERTNYNDDTLGRFEEISRELNSKRPFGRLVVLTGPPGTGKTYFIRGLMYEADKLRFLFVPPELLPKITGPAIIPSLLSLSEDDPEYRNVLVVEDADEALLKRGEKNRADLSILLNMSSGVLGELLDVRVLATTNAEYVEIDEALKREGRMINGEVRIGDLTQEKACQTLRRLTGDPDAVIAPGMLRLNKIYARAYELKRKNERS